MTTQDLPKLNPYEQKLILLWFLQFPWKIDLQTNKDDWFNECLREIMNEFYEPEDKELEYLTKDEIELNGPPRTNLEEYGTVENYLYWRLRGLERKFGNDFCPGELCQNHLGQITFNPEEDK